MAELVAASPVDWTPWSVGYLLHGKGRRAVPVPKGPRPRRVPASLRTISADPVELPAAPTHVLRLLAVSASADTFLDLV